MEKLPISAPSVLADIPTVFVSLYAIVSVLIGTPMKVLTAFGFAVKMKSSLVTSEIVMAV